MFFLRGREPPSPNSSLLLIIVNAVSAPVNMKLGIRVNIKPKLLPHKLDFFHLSLFKILFY